MTDAEVSRMLEENPEEVGLIKCTKILTQSSTNATSENANEQPYEEEKK